MTEVSVIIPVYNSESYVAETVRSVTEQTESNIEIIVVDDGSTDTTPAILRSLAAEDARVRVITRSNSGRPSVARNTGLQQATGRFVCFLDGDDLYRPRKIARSLEVFALYPEIDILFHDVSYLTSQGREMEETFLGAAGFQAKASDCLEDVGERVYLSRPNFYNFMSTTITGIHTSSVMIRRERLNCEKVWFPEELVIGEDIDLWFRLVKGSRVAYIDEVLSGYRQHEGSITKNVEKVLKGSILAHSENYRRGREILSKKEQERYRARISGQYFYLGYHYFREGRAAESRHAYLLSIKWRFNIVSVVAFMKTLVPPKAVAAYRKYALRRGC
jgi:glycosyltransferase involved in cell wall biosynthesis